MCNDQSLFEDNDCSRSQPYTLEAIGQGTVTLQIKLIYNLLCKCNQGLRSW